MIRLLRPILLALAVVAAASPWPSAQSAPPQKPADAKPAAAPADAGQKPADAKPAGELPADAKAFNAAAGEKDPLKRIAALEKFIADNPKASPMLVSQAKSQISSSALAAYKESRAKYLAAADADIAEAKKRSDGMPLYFTYNSLASRLVGAGIFSEEAEDYARKGLAAMDEATYLRVRKQQYERSLAAYEKAVAGPAGAAPGAAAPATPPAAATPATPPAPAYRFTTVDGVMQASLAPPPPPRPATPPPPPRPPTKPTLPSDDELRAALKLERATAQATLGQILVKRGKAEEGEKILEEAFAAKPSSSTMAAIARVLAESAKKAGSEARQLEFLTVVALSGRITADENKEFEALYRKAHNGSLDGLDAMLDARYRSGHTRFAVTPFARKAGEKPTGRTALIEAFPGAG